MGGGVERHRVLGGWAAGVRCERCECVVAVVGLLSWGFVVGGRLPLRNCASGFRRAVPSYGACLNSCVRLREFVCIRNPGQGL